MESHKFLGFVIVVIFGVNLLVSGLPVDNKETTTEHFEDEDNSTENGTHKELYVIKAVVYEIGILADVPDNDTTLENGTVTHQEVDVSFFDAETNATHFNLGDIPLPVQTNISGQIITGIAPVHIGAVHDLGEALRALPFSATIVNITESDTSYITVNRENITEAEQQITLADGSDLAKLPILNNVLLPNSFDEAFDSVTEKP